MLPIIKPCKCGGKAVVSSYDDGLPHVYCTVCGEEGLSWACKREAIHSWNGTPFTLKRRGKKG